jgi:hypothetical protein
MYVLVFILYLKRFKEAVQTKKDASRDQYLLYGKFDSKRKKDIHFKTKMGFKPTNSKSGIHCSGSHPPCTLLILREHSFVNPWCNK